VIDTGIDRNHPDLPITSGGTSPRSRGTDSDDDGNGHIDDTWGWDFCADAPPVAGTHGTQVAGRWRADGTRRQGDGMARTPS